MAKQLGRIGFQLERMQNNYRIMPPSLQSLFSTCKSLYDLCAANDKFAGLDQLAAMFAIFRKQYAKTMEKHKRNRSKTKHADIARKPRNAEVDDFSAGIADAAADAECDNPLAVARAEEAMLREYYLYEFE
jgi:hypothetical protein